MLVGWEDISPCPFPQLQSPFNFILEFLVLSSLIYGNILYFGITHCLSVYSENTKQHIVDCGNLSYGILPQLPSSFQLPVDCDISTCIYNILHQSLASTMPFYYMQIYKLGTTLSNMIGYQKLTGYQVKKYNTGSTLSILIGTRKRQETRLVQTVPGQPNKIIMHKFNCDTHTHREHFMLLVQLDATHPSTT